MRQLAKTCLPLRTHSKQDCKKSYSRLRKLKFCSDSKNLALLTLWSFATTHSVQLVRRFLTWTAQTGSATFALTSSITSIVRDAKQPILTKVFAAKTTSVSSHSLLATRSKTVHRNLRADRFQITSWLHQLCGKRRTRPNFLSQASVYLDVTHLRPAERARWKARAA